MTVAGETRTFCERRGATVTFVETAPTFRRGDSNSDGRVDISDAIRIFMYLFLGGAEPTCFDAADTNDDGRADLSDGVRILLDFFLPGTAISAPGPFECGPDPTGDSLGCGAQAPCDQVLI
jgi:hypothetical protein